MHCSYTHVHLIGIGGIHVSAIAKLLHTLGVSFSGSDLKENEEFAYFNANGFSVSLGCAAGNVPPQTDAVVFSSAVSEANPERQEATRRGLPQWNSHQFLGMLGEEMRQIIIAGTHGKSTTTAMMAVMAKEAGLHATTVVGTRVPQFQEGNIEIGTSDWLIAEGDEFDHHFLAYHPTVLVITGIEGDHFDIYPTIESMTDAYRALIHRVRDGGHLIVQGEDALVQALIQEERQTLQAREITVRTVGVGELCSIRLLDRASAEGMQTLQVYSQTEQMTAQLSLSVPGAMNAMNALMCYAVGEALAWPMEARVAGLKAFTGIWRRLEKIGEKDDAIILSDYGHHPTAVTRTLEAVKESYPDRRIVLCMQPHHRNRTKHLFTEFVGCFDLADVLVLVEIYDVEGRDAAEDAISSRELVDAIRARDATRHVSFAETPDAALESLRSLILPHDVVVVMGAGDIYKIAYDLV